MTARTWQAGDRIAERDGDTWWLGTIVDIDRDLLAIRFDGGERVGFRLANSSRLVALDDVPIDERHGPQLARAARALLNPAPQTAATQ